ncbi:MAG: phage integrase SAM-like domain-containing protein [Candidatus Sulfotelmatobacter sp.]
MNREVNLTKRVQTPYGWRYCRLVFSAKGRIKPDLAVVNGKQECYKEGAYYLEWREGARGVRLSVGKDPADASARRQRKEAELDAINNGVPVRTSPDGQNGHRMVSTAVAQFLEETKLTKKSKTHAAYDTSLRYFMESCPKLYLEDLPRSDLLKFAAFLRDEKELHPRTRWNKFSNVMSFLKAQGIRGIAHKNDWPRYVEEEPEVYEREDLDKLCSL